jgi:acyl carrier protein
LIRQITESAHFANDLGLDSLDTVEVVMAIEEVRFPADLPGRCGTGRRPPFLFLPGHDECEADGVATQEFSIEIPDKDADTIHSGTLDLRSDAAFVAQALTSLGLRS